MTPTQHRLTPHEPHHLLRMVGQRGDTTLMLVTNEVKYLLALGTMDVCAAHTSVVKLLLAMGADVTATNHVSGYVLLGVVVVGRCGWYDFVLAMGANVSAKH